MVQYVFTPWRDRQELLTVRRQLYPERHGSPAAAAGQKDRRQHAVARVSVWMQRGNCPHLVESTALLKAAILSDLDACSTSERGAARLSGSYAARAAYSAAFSRFVTGLLDSNQDKQHKMSMYAVAKSVGLPATFVELRHQATHEQLPSLTRLRAAAGSALDWIWDYYWRHLADDDDDSDDEGEPAHDPPAFLFSTECRTALVNFLSAINSDAEEYRGAELRRYREDEILAAATEMSERRRDPKTLQTTLSFIKETLHGQRSETIKDGGMEGVEGVETTKDPDVVRLELARQREELEEVQSSALFGSLYDSTTFDDVVQDAEEEDDGPSWSRYDTGWIPKPIGLV